jgi:pilus assembly protein CpaE
VENQEVSTETNILLPTARVDLFVKDKETLEAARALKDDWRFARVTLSVEEGDVDGAIKNYAQASAPDLVIIETEITGDEFVQRLHSLSAYCDENTNAIVIGPVNDVDLYRSLTSMGVSDYLVKPVAYNILSEIIAKALIDQLGVSGSRLIGVIGAKGGVGTSALTQGLAWGLSDQLQQKTFLLDAAGGWSTTAVGVGFEPSATMHEAVSAAASQDEDNLKRMLFKASDQLTVLATGADAMLEASVHAQQFEDLIDWLMQSYPVVLVDLSGAIPSLKKTVVTKAHELVVVTTPTLPALRSARSLIGEVKTLHGGDDSNIDLIVNMAGVMPSKEVPKKDIETALDYKPSTVISFDPKLFLGNESEGKKLSDNKNGMEIINKLLPVAEKILLGKSEQSQQGKDSFLDNILSKVKSKG